MEKNEVSINFRLSPELKARIKEECMRRSVSLSSFIKNAIADKLPIIEKDVEAVVEEEVEE